MLIVSVGREDPHAGKMGLVEGRRLLNVAMSRARLLFILAVHNNIGKPSRGDPINAAFNSKHRNIGMPSNVCFIKKEQLLNSDNSRQAGKELKTLRIES